MYVVYGWYGDCLTFAGVFDTEDNANKYATKLNNETRAQFYVSEQLTLNTVNAKKYSKIAIL